MYFLCGIQTFLRLSSNNFCSCWMNVLLKKIFNDNLIEAYRVSFHKRTNRLDLKQKITRRNVISCDEYRNKYISYLIITGVRWEILARSCNYNVNYNLITDYIGGIRVAHILFFCVVLCFVCLRLVSSVRIVDVSLDCPSLIAPSVFSNVYLMFNDMHWYIRNTWELTGSLKKFVLPELFFCCFCVTLNCLLN